MNESMAARRRAASDPTRLRIWELAEAGPRTAKEMADELGVPTNGLYYHLRVMERAGVIEVIDSKPVGRFTERVYGLTEKQRVTWDATEPLERAIHLASVLEACRAHAERALYEQARQVESGDSPIFVTYATHAISSMTPDDVAGFQARLTALLAEFGQRPSTRKRRKGQHLPREAQLKFTYVLHEAAQGRSGA